MNVHLQIDVVKLGKSTMNTATVVNQKNGEESLVKNVENHLAKLKLVVTVGKN